MLSKNILESIRAKLELRADNVVSNVNYIAGHLATGEWIIVSDGALENEPVIGVYAVDSLETMVAVHAEEYARSVKQALALIDKVFNDIHVKNTRNIFRFSNKKDMLAFTAALAGYNSYVENVCIFHDDEDGSCAACEVHKRIEDDFYAVMTSGKPVRAEIHMSGGLEIIVKYEEADDASEAIVRLTTLIVSSMQ
ncbi:MAG: hypothetical protein MJ155_02675 [Candidatus Saccharibacteria bacterium]|nr:hypothetical protein [Candidatus Saccharibacteria bacterium]